jgi:hypothetical protein
VAGSCLNYSNITACADCSSIVPETLTFDQALSLGAGNGGGSDYCARAGYLAKEFVAATLNLATIDFTCGTITNESQLVNAVNAALSTCNANTVKTLADQLDTCDNAGCPLKVSKGVCTGGN